MFFFFTPMLARLTLLVLGTLYPAYASFKAVKNKSSREYVRWMMYWIVFAIFLFCEAFFDFFLYYLPFYHELKILLIIYLMAPFTRGSSVLYRRLIHPYLVQHEGDIDNILDRMKCQSVVMIKDLGARGLQTANQMLVAGIRNSMSLSDITTVDGALRMLGGGNPATVRREQQRSAAAAAAVDALSVLSEDEAEYDSQQHATVSRDTVTKRKNLATEPAAAFGGGRRRAASSSSAVKPATTRQRTTTKKSTSTTRHNSDSAHVTYDADDFDADDDAVGGTDDVDADPTWRSSVADISSGSGGNLSFSSGNENEKVIILPSTSEAVSVGRTPLAARPPIHSAAKSKQQLLERNRHVSSSSQSYRQQDDDVIVQHVSAVDNLVTDAVLNDIDAAAQHHGNMPKITVSRTTRSKLAAATATAAAVSGSGGGRTGRSSSSSGRM